MKADAVYESLFKYMLDEVHYWQLVRDDAGNIKTWRLLDINLATERSWGKTRDEVVGKTTEEIFSPAARDLFLPIVIETFRTGAPFTWQTYFPDLDQHLKMTSIPFFDSFISTGVDITDLVNAKNLAEEKEGSLKLVLEVSDLGYWDHDFQTKKTVRSLKHDQQLGLIKIASEWTHEIFLKHVLEEDRQSVDIAFKKARKDAGNYDVEFRCQWPDKSIHWLRSKGKFIADAEGNVIRAAGTQSDITSAKEAEKKIENLAFHDPLTQLPNRLLITERLKQATIHSKRTKKPGALLFIDLDNFKDLNDSLGHNTGDLLLQQVAERLVKSVREDDSVGRFGGDEFVVLLADLGENKLNAAAEAESIANTILSALNNMYQLNPHEIHITASIGITLYNQHNSGFEALLRQADIAMYKAKQSYRSRVCFFDDLMQKEVSHRADIDRNLRTSIEFNQLHLYYQLQLGVDRLPLGAEALIRWQHPTLGLVSPADFIPIAEQSDLILSIGEWVIDAACRQLKLWEKHQSTRLLTLSVNVSAKQFIQEDFAERVQAVLQKHSVEPNKLRLELTESMLVDDIERIISVMESLAAIGIRFELDDFGTGYSSMQNLKRLPINRLKIDQSFVSNLQHDHNDRAIVRAIISMAESLGVGVIAEGVETKAQQKILHDNKCTQYQGYLFSKPLPIAEFDALMTGKQ